MLGFIITSLIIGLVLLFVSIYNVTEHKEPSFIFITIFVGFYLLGSMLYFTLSPTDQNVRNGSAEYVKEHHIEISSNDTIEYDVYRLEWINKQ